ncbi:Ankyrin repeat [Macleaya cordata]|uniref:Ankyrin repeat n=1 Tax=Macleaya cordata TaxID=56857 RepID=A0A200QY43_MACCD|nr:Ankyrin repeat [Macleaya cordata]
MMVFGHSNGGFLAGKQVFPVDYEAEVSQRLIEASHISDLNSAFECISDPSVDVNFIGAVCLKTRKTEVVMHDESSNEVRIEYEEFKSDVTTLFLAAHSGNLTLVRKLLSVGADVNQKLFRGFATTAAVREGHLEILEILLKAGASQLACEEALLEASYHGRARLTELLMGSDMIRPHVAVHALVTACCRGFVEVVDKLMKCGVDANTTDRVLLRSSMPSLHTNADCTALVAAIVSRQVSVVRQLLQVGVKTDTKVRLGAWSWDTNSGEECKVGAGLAEPYPITWCAVEYYEASGSILRLLLKNHSPNIQHYGRTLLHHAILCNNARALQLLLNCGADVEFMVKTTRKTSFRPIHMASRLGFDRVVQCLVNSSCNLNSQTESGETALMICARGKRDECLRILASAGADFGLVSFSGQCASSIAESNRWSMGFQRVVLDIIRSGKIIQSSNLSVFSPLMFVARAGNVEALKILIEQPDTNLDLQDDNGLSALMVVAMGGHVEAFRLLVYAGADVKLCNKSGETAISLSELNQNRDLFEKVLLEYALEKGNHGARGFYVLHCAARRGDVAAVRLLTNRGYDVNLPDGDDYTPLMLAAREGHGNMCELLISCGARCDLKTARGETALSLARKNGGIGSEAENVILDQLARVLVLNGSNVRKHTKGGKGAPHAKVMRMVGAAGVLRWGKSSRRNVICREALVGPSSMFRKNRERKGCDGNEKGVFRVATTKNKEFHFVTDGGVETAELWVRGIKLVTREAIFGKKQSESET